MQRFAAGGVEDGEDLERGGGEGHVMTFNLEKMALQSSE